MLGNLWFFTDARGVECRGEFLKCIEGQGTDVTMVFRLADGTVSLVSGSRLKTCKRISPFIDRELREVE